MTYHKVLTGGYDNLETLGNLSEDEVDLYDETVLAHLASIEILEDNCNELSIRRAKQKLADYLWETYGAVPSEVGVEL